MLRFLTPMNRREWLRLGTLAGLTLPRALAAPVRSTLPGFGKAKSVLVVFAGGGQSQLDTWDPKPNAPAEVRGSFGTIATALPGVRVCEHMPMIARRLDRCTLVRSMSHDDLDHGSACYLSLTGQFHPRKSSNPIPKPSDYPVLGSIVQRVRPARGLPYSAALLNGPLLAPELVSAGQYPGLLGRAYEPLQLGDVSQGSALLSGLDPRADLPAVRLEKRRSLLQSLEGYQRKLEADAACKEVNVLRAQARKLLASPKSRLAFDLTREPLSVRERYGLHRTGQACLLARRLVEAEMPFITVFYNPSIRGQDKDSESTDAFGWDTHNDIFSALKDHLLPRFDQSFTALLDDLEQRGLMETTLVVCMGEFGRAPLVALEKTFAGSTPGRKHWGAVYSLLLAGAGVSRGKVLGASDKRGAYPATTAYNPVDVAATLFHAMGIDPAGHYRDALDRPFRISEGKVMSGLY